MPDAVFLRGALGGRPGRHVRRGSTDEEEDWRRNGSDLPVAMLASAD
jgi:hypothetical protein